MKEGDKKLGRDRGGDRRADTKGERRNIWRETEEETEGKSQRKRNRAGKPLLERERHWDGRQIEEEKLEWGTYSAYRRC
jgi:hypothetical protein